MSPADVACLMRISINDGDLTTIDATSCNKQISDSVIKFIACYQPLLHTLKLAGCKTISANAFNVRYSFIRLLFLILLII